MKFLATADLHVKVWTDKLYDENGHPMKLIETLNAFDQMCQYGVKNDIKNVIIAGDVNDLKNIVHYKSFVMLKNLISRYQDIKFYIISGNHDEASREDMLSAIQLLDGPDNVITIVKNPMVIDDITFIPWSSNVLDNIRKCEGNNILISHFGLNEAMVNSGLSIRSKIGLKDVQKFNTVILGHYHLPQTIENVWYTGNLIQKDYGEAGEEKRFLVVDSDNGTIDSIPTYGYRKYFNIEINDKTEIDNIIEEVSKLKKDGNYITIRNKTDSDITIDDVKIVTDYNDTSINRGITTSMSISEQLKKYLVINNIPEDRHEEYLSSIINILNQ